jgi:hypothetical protein
MAYNEVSPIKDFYFHYLSPPFPSPNKGSLATYCLSFIRDWRPLMSESTLFLGAWPPEPGAIFVLGEAADALPEIRLRLPADVPFEAETPFSFDDIQLFSYQPEGPVVRFICRIYQDMDHLERPLLAMEIFLDPVPYGQHRPLLERLTTCTEIRVRVWHEANPPVEVGRKDFAWKPNLQEAMRTVLSEGRRIVSRTPWPAAARRCQRENPLTL